MTKWTRTIALGVAATSLLGVTTACSSSSKQANSSGHGGAGTSASSSATAAAATTVKIGIFAGDGSAPWEIADQQGFFAKQGIKAEFVNFTSGPAIVAALLSGSVDVGEGTSGAVYQVVRQSPQVTVLNDFSQTNYTVIVVNSSKATSSVSAGYPANVKSLKGLKIGVPALGSQLQNLITGVLQNAGLSAGDVTFIATGGLSTIIAALKNNRIDAQPVTWATVALLKKAGLSITPVIDVAQPGNAGPGFSKGLFTFDLASTSFASSNSGLLGKYCTAMRDAVNWAKSPANLTSVSGIVAKLDGVTAAGIQPIWPKVTPTYTTSLTESAWSSQPSWVTGGGTIPAYSKSVTSCAP